MNLMEARAQAHEREMGRIMKRLADYEANFPVNTFADHYPTTPQIVPHEVVAPSDLADPDIERLECHVRQLLK